MNTKFALVGLFAVLLIAGGAYWTMANKPADSGQVVNQMPVVTSGENPQPGSSVHDLPVEPAATVARKDLAAKLNIDEKAIVIMEVEEKTWSDGCLGLAKPGEFCTQALVPGFKVEMLAKGESYTYRTNQSGTVIRTE
jgi:hypothetical protein